MPFNVPYVLNSVLTILHYILLARIILAWIPSRPGGLLADITEVVYSITEPLLAPIRKIVPPIAMGAGYLDLSPIIFIMLLILLRGMLF